MNRELLKQLGLEEAYNEVVRKDAQMQTALPNNCHYNQMLKQAPAFSNKIVEEVRELSKGNLRVSYKDATLGPQGIILQKSADFTPTKGMLAIQIGGVSMGERVQLCFFDETTGQMLFNKVRQRCATEWENV